MLDHQNNESYMGYVKTVTPREIPLSCYLIPDFWKGAKAVRAQLLHDNNDVNNNMLKAIDVLEEATISRQDLSSLPEYQIWLSSPI